MFFDSFDWGALGRRFINATISAAPGIYASNVANRKIAHANERAGNIITNAGREQVANLEAIRRKAEAEAAPAISHYRATLAQPAHVLTPAQTVNLNDARRTLRESGAQSRFGGRAFARQFADVENRVRAGATSENIRRQDAAAGQLYGRQSTAYNAMGRQGDVAGDVATNQAALTTAAGENQANTVAAIGTYFANAIKDADRERRYREYQQTKPGGI